MRLPLRLRRASIGLAAVILAISAALAQTAKRPLNHKDYDGWRAITGQKLSPDGKYLAYGVFPQEGDGELIVRNLVTGQDTRFPAGARPQPAASATEEGTTPEARGTAVVFTSDSRYAAFSTFPSKADTEKARKDKKPADQMPKDGMVIVDLASGKSNSIDRVKRFAVPEKGGDYLAYQLEAPETKPDTKPAAPATENKPNDADRQARPGGRGNAPAASASAKPQFGTDLVLRSLSDAAERTFTDALDFSFSEDGKHLVFTVSAHDSAKNGVFVARPESADAPALLAGGIGKYSKLTWDENQTQLVFLSDRDDADAKQPKLKIYRWDRRPGAAEALVSGDMPGLRPGMAISDKGTLGFSRDGSRLFFGVAVPQPEKPDAADASSDDKAVVDLWSYRDDYLQSAQKVRATRERDRTFEAAYLAPERKVVQLADESMETVIASESPEWILGTDDREYRRLQDYDEHYSDTYLVDATTGGRRLLEKRNAGSVSWSPGGRYLLHFDGKDWSSISIPDGKTVNLTSALGVKFFNEDTDTPNLPPAYGSAGWTKDGKYALIYDRYDIWSVAPDGGAARNITASYGRAHELRLRYVRTETDPRERWIDPAKPLLLAAENLKTHDSGFFRGSVEGGEPKQLLMAAKSFSTPVRARDAEVYLLTEQTFDEFPDLFTTGPDFKELRKASDANPQKSQLLWGSAELVSFKNADGVPLQAALYKPEGFDAHKKYPMMVYIYERLAQSVNHFAVPAPGTSINLSYYVSNGYLVLTPDIVYTTGYPGQSALKCVLPAIQAVVDRGIVDENAIGIQGHSWGGYQIAYMVTQTNRFRAVEAGAPVADMISAYDGIRWGTGITRQFQYEKTQSRIGGSIWQYPTRFIENSPIFWADRVQTPVLILQNDGDDAVPWYQGLEYFLALRRLGKEVYLFNYNGQPHGLRSRPDQKDFTIRMQEYFDHYLKGAPAPDWMTKGVSYLDRDQTELETLMGGQ